VQALLQKLQVEQRLMKRRVERQLASSVRTMLRRYRHNVAGYPAV